jgi:hypothetical protein
MSDNENKKPTDESFPSAIKEISLSQAILAPLDALFQAQVHGARSFLNLLLQIGYPHVEIDENGLPREEEKKDKPVYMQEFIYEEKDNRKMKVSIPALSLVPITPLSIDNAKFKLDFRVDKLDKYQQMQASEKPTIDREKTAGWGSDKRPWYLVQNPVSFMGNVAPGSEVKSESSTSSSSVISIEINLTRQPLPAGLDKLMTAMQQSSHMQLIPDTPSEAKIHPGELAEQANPGEPIEE